MEKSNNANIRNWELLIQLMSSVLSDLDQIKVYRQKNSQQEFYTINEAADFLRVAPITVRRIIDEGLIYTYKISDKRKSKQIIKKSDIIKYLEGK